MLKKREMIKNLDFRKKCEVVAFLGNLGLLLEFTSFTQYCPVKNRIDSVGSLNLDFPSKKKTRKALY
jgi:hypothetical protein